MEKVLDSCFRTIKTTSGSHFHIQPKIALPATFQTWILALILILYEFLENDFITEGDPAVFPFLINQGGSFLVFF
jgi:hypothetical protein